MPWAEGLLSWVVSFCLTWFLTVSVALDACLCYTRQRLQFSKRKDERHGNAAKGFSLQTRKCTRLLNGKKCIFVMRILSLFTVSVALTVFVAFI